MKFGPKPLELTLGSAFRVAEPTICMRRRWRKPACSMTAAKESAPRTSQIVVSRLDNSAIVSASSAISTTIGSIASSIDGARF